MADKKFGQKRICPNPHCEIKFYDLNKKSPLSCPQCKTEVVVEEELMFSQSNPVLQSTSKTETKDEFADLENADNSSDENEEDVISLDDAAIEEEQNTKN
tara:strand:- start:5195 stop:5494 length:300 start_codon:yes stop_codon:yes gene_type:complete